MVCLYEKGFLDQLPDWVVEYLMSCQVGWNVLLQSMKTKCKIWKGTIWEQFYFDKWPVKRSTWDAWQSNDWNRQLFETSEELEEVSSDLHNWIVDLKFIQNRKSYDDIEQFQSKILELQEANTALNGVVECSIKLEIVSEPFSEANDDCITKCLLREWTGETEYFQEGCSEFEEKM